MELINKRLRKIGLIVTHLVFLLPGIAFATWSIKDFNGVWTVKKYLLANISAWSDSKADRYIGSKLIVANDDLCFDALSKKYKCSLNNKSVRIFKHNLKNDSLVDPVQKGWLDPSKMGLKKDQNITKVLLNSLNMPFEEVIFLEKDKKIFIGWDGALFLLVRASN